MPQKEFQELAHFFCVVCGSYFNRAAAHTLSEAITMKPPAGLDLPANATKRPLLAAMHVSCYPKSIGHEASFSGQWPDPQTYTRVAFDTMNNVPTFFELKEVKSMAALLSEGT